MYKAMLAKEAKRPFMWYADNHYYVAEPKINGQRLLTEFSGGKVSGFNRLGQPMNLGNDFPQPEGWIGHWILDGEWVDKDKQYYVFDMLMRDGEGMIWEAHFKRRMALEAFINEHPVENMIIVPIFREASDKYWLYNETEKRGMEGIVLKNSGGAYLQANKTEWVKIKHFKTLDCFILELNRGGKQQAVTLGLYDANGNEVEIGGCKLPLSALKTAEVGTVIEVDYQHATPSDNLYIPKFKHIRLDKPKEECYTSQLQYENPDIIKGTK